MRGRSGHLFVEIHVAWSIEIAYNRSETKFHTLRS